MDFAGSERQGMNTNQPPLGSEPSYGLAPYRLSRFYGKARRIAGSKAFATRILFALLILVPSYAQCVLNNPYPPNEAAQKIYYSSFNEQPKTLDPARSYSANEYLFISQIYEPVLQYDYLKRPYTLIPLTATQMPVVKYFDKNHNQIKEGKGEVAYSVYTITIKKGIFYQPHPAFATDEKGKYRYHHLNANYIYTHNINQISDFPYTGTRELIVDDYIYQIKRLANPQVNSSIYGLLTSYIDSFSDFAKILPKNTKEHVDLRKYPLKGVTKIDQYTFEIKIIGQYPQFLFWLAMPFFSPIPWEADLFYGQPGMQDNNIDFGWYPVGTGPFMLTENNPNSQMVLTKNPNYRQEFFPTGGSLEDEQAGYLLHKGERLPLIAKAIYTLEKESIPRWSKFLQGYYDLSGVSADSFNQAIKIDSYGHLHLTPEMKNKGLKLSRTSDPTIYYLGFNMLDAVVGGYSEKAKKLRQAISIAVDFDENIAIFYNGRGKPAQGPLPPGIFGNREDASGVNPYTYIWKNNTKKRRPIAEAKHLLAQAGYPNGKDPATGKALILNYDVPASGGPDDKEQLNWMRKQFAKIGIDLNVRATLYNRFQEKMRVGNAQIFSWGWNADYPDPENFLFLLYGPNGKVKYGGENAANYNNPKFDRLFIAMKNRPNDVIRQQLIDQMIELVRNDSPWIWGINTESLVLSQQWVSPMKPNTISASSLKYLAINVPLRNQLRELWNQPILWPIGVLLLVLVALILPFIFAFYRKQQQTVERLKG